MPLMLGSRTAVLEGAVTVEEAEPLAAWLRETPTKGWRGKTERSIYGLHGRLRDLRAFIGWCMDEERGLIDWRVKVIIPKLPEEDFPIFSDAELVAIFSTPHLTAKGEQGIRNRALVGLLLDTGMRLGELAGLSPADLEMEDRLLKVTGKGNRSRRIPFSEASAQNLAVWLKVRGKAPGNLFLLSYDGTRMLLKRIEREAGVPIWAHRFRHQAATMLVRKKVNPSAIRRIMGHRQLSTTEKYVTLYARDLRDQHDEASPLESVRALLPQEREKPKRRRYTLE